MAAEAVFSKLQKYLMNVCNSLTKLAPPLDPHSGNGSEEALMLKVPFRALLMKEYGCTMQQEETEIYHFEFDVFAACREQSEFENTSE